MKIKKVSEKKRDIKLTPNHKVWRFNHKIRSMPPGKILRIETIAPAVIHWSTYAWNTVQDVTVQDVGLGIYIADLTTNTLPEEKQIKFTFYWPDADNWEDTNFTISDQFLATRFDCRC